MRYVVVGGGIAGVCCALELARCLQEKLWNHPSSPQGNEPRPEEPTNDEADASINHDQHQALKQSGGAAGIASLADEVILVSSSSVIKGVREVARLSRLVEELELVESSLEELATGTNGILKVVRGISVGMDLEARVLQLEGGTSLQYDKLCLCTGARPKELQVPGADHPSVMTLRDTDSVQELARRLRGCRRLLLVGNGGIALELAGALLQLQNQGSAPAPRGGPSGPAPAPAPMGPASDGPGQRPELVWVLKHGHVGDAFFDLDAARFLLEDRLQPAAAAPPPPPLEVPAARRGGGGGGSGSQVSAAVTAAREASGTSVGRGGRGRSSEVRSHAAGPVWTQELMRGLAMAQGSHESSATTGAVGAAMAVGADTSSAGAGVGGSGSGREEMRQTGYPSAASAANGSVGRCGGSGTFRLVLEFSTTVARIDSGGNSCAIPLASARATEGSSHADAATRVRAPPETDTWPVQVTLSNGKVYGSDLVVCGIGVVPATEWLPPQLARGSDGGVAVDLNLRTSDPHVFAAGDCCTADWPNGSRHWFQMRLWTQARVMGSFAAHSMLGRVDELHSGFNFELFTHVTRFLGAKVVLLGLYNGQRLEQEPAGEIHLYSRIAPAADGNGNTFVRVLMLRGRMQGAVLIGETELEEALENIILDGLDLSSYGPHILDDDFELDHVFD